MNEQRIPPRSRPDQQPGHPPVHPFRPRPRLFAILLIAFIVWIIALLGLYFKTVYPLRHPANSQPSIQSVEH